jgi:hypothetical protein
MDGPAKIGYDVGIAFDEPGSWNRGRFAPKHLLEVPLGRTDTVKKD